MGVVVLPVVYYAVLYFSYVGKSPSLREWAEVNPAAFGLGLVVAVPGVLAVVSGGVFG